jgi:hypothetical protein
LVFPKTALAPDVIAPEPKFFNSGRRLLFPILVRPHPIDMELVDQPLDVLDFFSRSVAGAYGRPRASERPCGDGQQNAPDICGQVAIFGRHERELRAKKGLDLKIQTCEELASVLFVAPQVSPSIKRDTSITVR